MTCIPDCTNNFSICIPINEMRVCLMKIKMFLKVICIKISLIYMSTIDHRQLFMKFISFVNSKNKCTIILNLRVDVPKNTECQ